MNRKILLVTPFFAPQSHAAVFRAFKLAKYLPSYGWKPYVLTVDTNYQYNEDVALLDELPPAVEIVRARYVEPTLRGARMAIGGKDRTFQAVKNQLMTSVEAGPNQASPWSDAGHRAYRYLSEHWLETPDPYWTWYRPALRSARQLVTAHDIPIVYTTCLPYTCNQIGRALQNDGRRWVADFRDPPTYSARMSSGVNRVYLKQRQIERDTLRHADAVTVLSSAYEFIFKDMHGTDPLSPMHFIPTGVDEDYLPDHAAPARPYPYLVFTGEYLPEYSTEFLEAFALALQYEAVRISGTRLLVIGRQEVNRDRLMPTLTRLGIVEAVEFFDHLPQRDLYVILKGARAGVLVPGHTSHWWTSFAKMADYIALRVPCLAIVPDPSEARTALSKTGLGVFLDGDRRTNARSLSQFLTSDTATVLSPNCIECRRYLVSAQMEAFVATFENLLTNQPNKSRRVG